MANPQPEPSMEEILASIRRIISEDEEEEINASAAPKTPPLRTPQPAADSTPTADGDSAADESTDPVSEASTDDQADVNDDAIHKINEAAAALTEAPVEDQKMVEEPADETVNSDPADTEITDNAQSRLATEHVEMIKHSQALASDENGFDDAIVSDVSAAAAKTAFQSLSQNMRVATSEGRTLEDIVVEMLKPLVKEWLDANLPAIVERKVEDEVERIARRR